MGKHTQVVLKSRDCTEFGLPKKLGIYDIGEARQIGQHHNIPVTILRETDLHLPRPPVQLQAASADAARAGTFTSHKLLMRKPRRRLAESNAMPPVQ